MSDDGTLKPVHAAMTQQARAPDDDVNPVA